MSVSPRLSLRRSPLALQGETRTGDGAAPRTWSTRTPFGKMQVVPVGRWAVWKRAVVIGICEPG